MSITVLFNDENNPDPILKVVTCMLAHFNSCICAHSIFTGRNIWSDEVTAHYRSMLFCVISMSALRKHIMLLLALVLPAFILHNVCNFEF